MTNPETVIAEALRCSSPFGPGGEAGSHPDWLRDWLDELPEHLLTALKSAGIEWVERDEAVAYSVVLDGTLEDYEQVIAGTADAAEASR